MYAFHKEFLKTNTNEPAKPKLKTNVNFSDFERGSERPPYITNIRDAREGHQTFGDSWTSPLHHSHFFHPRVFSANVLPGRVFLYDPLPYRTFICKLFFMRNFSVSASFHAGTLLSTLFHEAPFYVKFHHAETLRVNSFPCSAFLCQLSLCRTFPCFLSDSHSMH